MTDQTKALLPVTHEDRDEAAKFLRGVYGEHAFDSLWAPTIERGAADWHAIVRLVAAVRQSHSLPGEAIEALTMAAEWFEDYARQHRAKQTADADAKAETNDERANFLRNTLAALTPSPCPGDGK